MYKRVAYADRRVVQSCNCSMCIMYRASFLLIAISVVSSFVAHSHILLLVVLVVARGLTISSLPSAHSQIYCLQFCSTMAILVVFVVARGLTIQFMYTFYKLIFTQCSFEQTLFTYHWINQTTLFHQSKGFPFPWWISCHLAASSRTISKRFINSKPSLVTILYGNVCFQIFLWIERKRKTSTLK